ncbi:MAG: substrate-binding domain-containing protein [Motiliproteus sp.]
MGIKPMKVLLGLVAFAAISTTYAADQKIIGAGPSTKVASLFVEEFTKAPEANGYTFFVPPRSAKHAGGIKASNDFIFGRTGRPLNAKERDQNKDEIFLARIPVAFVVGSGAAVSKLSMGQVEGIFSGTITNWKEVGGGDAKILLAGREQKEALFSVLKAKYPSFSKAKFDKVFKKDHQVVNFLKSPAGKFAIGFGAKPNFSDLNVLSVREFSVGVSVGLVYDNKNSGDPLVGAAKRFAASADWHSKLGSLELLPPE